MSYARSAVSTVLSVSTLLVGLTACSNGVVDPTWPPDVDGTWEWEYTLRRSAEEEVQSPATEGFTAQLTLIVDGWQGAFEYSKDGDVVVVGRFGIGYEDAPGNDYIVWEPAFGSFHDQQWLTLIVGDSLRFADATVGGYESMWARAR
jgi:hypothetical protein